MKDLSCGDGWNCWTDLYLNKIVLYKYVHSFKYEYTSTHEKIGEK